MIDRILPPILVAGCAICAVIIGIELLPAAPAPTAPVSVAGSAGEQAPPERRASPHADLLVAAILARPLFSTTRRPTEDVQIDLAGSRLTGIVIEPSRRVAIFAVDGGKAIELAEGDSVGGWRIERIAAREVRLTGAGGTRTIKPRADPTMIRPTAAPGAMARPLAGVPVAQGAVAPIPAMPSPVPPAPASPMMSRGVAVPPAGARLPR